jgi:plastocyanin
VNNDNVTHTIMATGNNTGMFTSSALIPGEGFQYTFNTDAGTVTYALADNSSVTGTIIVQSPGVGHSSVS